MGKWQQQKKDKTRIESKSDWLFSPAQRWFCWLINKSTDRRIICKNVKKVAGWRWNLWGFGCLYQFCMTADWISRHHVELWWLVISLYKQVWKLIDYFLLLYWSDASANMIVRIWVTPSIIIRITIILLFYSLITQTFLDCSDSGALWLTAEVQNLTLNLKPHFRQIL